MNKTKRTKTTAPPAQRPAVGEKQRKRTDSHSSIVPAAKPMQTANHERARAEFSKLGVSMTEWARLQGVSRSLVYEVLSGRPCLRGASHRIAVLLGIKDGKLSDGPEAVTRALHRDKEAA